MFENKLTISNMAWPFLAINYLLSINTSKLKMYTKTINNLCKQGQKLVCYLYSIASFSNSKHTLHSMLWTSMRELWS